MNKNKEHIARIYIQRLLRATPKLRSDDEQLQYILEYLPKERDIQILDAGCGNGKYAFKLCELEYKNIFAVDLYDKIETDNKFSYFQESIDDLSFENNKFDFIYSISVIYHLREPGDAVKEFHRVLKRRGTVIITAHTKYSLYTLWRVIKRSMGMKNVEHLKGVKFQSANYYKRLFERNGFKVIYIGGFGFFDAFHKLRDLIIRGIKTKGSLPGRKIERNRSMAYIKSLMAYHSIIVARKL
jgi:SAM-dependent methyltransferase